MKKKAKSVLTTLGAFLSQIWTGEQPNNLYRLHEACAFFLKFPLFQPFCRLFLDLWNPIQLESAANCEFAAGTCCVFFSPGICWRFLEFCHEDVPGARNHQVALGIQLVKKRAPKRCLGYIPGDEILPRTKNGGFFKQPKLAPLLVQLRELNLESNCWWFRNLVFTTRDP